MKRHLVIFLRAPQRGRVKRRLARAIGDSAALAFHRATATALLRRVGHDRRWHCRLALTPDHRALLPRGWRGVGIMAQGGGDLGRRMARVFRALPPGPAVIVGADIPDLSARHVAQAFAALGRHDAVVGPAADGGYWLIGLQQPRTLPRGLFAGVRWSTEHALADTLASLPRRWRVGRLETLADIDDGDAYRRWLIRRRRDAP